MEISDDEIKNVQRVASRVREKIFNRQTGFNENEIIKLRTNPLMYFVDNGLKESLRRAIESAKLFYHEFQSAFRIIARRILDKGGKVLDDCFQCVAGLLILIMIIFNGASISYPMFFDLKEMLTHVLEIYFGANLLAKGIVTKITDSLKKAGLPHLSPNNLAQYVCYKAGICSEKGIV